MPAAGRDSRYTGRVVTFRTPGWVGTLASRCMYHNNLAIGVRRPSDQRNVIMALIVVIRAVRDRNNYTQAKRQDDVMLCLTAVNCWAGCCWAVCTTGRGRRAASGVRVRPLTVRRRVTHQS